MLVTAGAAMEKELLPALGEACCKRVFSFLPQSLQDRGTGDSGGLEGFGEGDSLRVAIFRNGRLRGGRWQPVELRFFEM